MNTLSKEHFEKVLSEVCEQVFEGKGKDRHGHGDTFSQQPWVAITRNMGDGFVLGQAMKKLMELRSFPNDQTQSSLHRWTREAVGAVVYIIMGIMWREHEVASKFLNRDASIVLSKPNSGKPGDDDSIVPGDSPESGATSPEAESARRYLTRLGKDPSEYNYKD